MASSKPKKTAAKTKATQKSKATTKAAKTEVKAEVKATEKVGKKVSKVEAEPVKAAEKPATKKTEAKKEDAKKPGGFKLFLKDFFAKKCDSSENILTIFQNKKFYAALLAEFFGMFILSVVMLTLGIYQPLYVFFIVIAVTLAVFKTSGANLNPLITVGMMATRRMSAIRGVLYILVQIIGAWLGLVVVNAFRMASTGDAELPVMAEVADGMFWTTTLLEFFGAAIIAFFFAKALHYRHSSFTFAVTAAGGVMIAFVVIYLISYNYFGLGNNFMMNPAIALMHQILPTSGETFGALLGQVGLALTTYVAFPMLGGVVGFYISDIISVLNGEDTKM